MTARQAMDEFLEAERERLEYLVVSGFFILPAVPGDVRVQAIFI